MTNIRIEWLYDSTDCDQAGCSGGYAEGAKVYFDDKLTLDMSPMAACFGGIHYRSEDVLSRIFEELGHKLVEVTYG
jgi:hypothetical protein